jgi:hypothetical protein
MGCALVISRGVDTRGRILGIQRNKGEGVASGRREGEKCEYLGGLLEDQSACIAGGCC